MYESHLQKVCGGLSVTLISECNMVMTQLYVSHWLPPGPQYKHISTLLVAIVSLLQIMQLITGIAPEHHIADIEVGNVCDQHNMASVVV